MGFGKDGKGVIIRQFDTIVLGALAAQAVVKQSNPFTLGEDFRMLKFEIFADMAAVPAFADSDGPVLVGIANNEFSVAEISESLGANGPTDRNERLEQEHAERAVWPYFMMNFDSVTGTKSDNVIRMPQTGSPRWTFSDPEGWCWFGFNMGSGALNTGASIRFECKFYGVWVT